MPSTKVRLFLFAALAASLSAPSAVAKPRAPQPASKDAAPATALAPLRIAYIPAPRRAEQPALALRPEFSEGEWPQPEGTEQLDPAALQEAAAPVESEVGRATTGRAGSNLAKIGDRQLQGSPIPTSRLDQPIGAGPSAVVTTGGFDFSGFNVRFSD